MLPVPFSFIGIYSIEYPLLRSSKAFNSLAGTPARSARCLSLAKLSSLSCFLSLVFSAGDSNKYPVLLEAVLATFPKPDEAMFFMFSLKKPPVACFLLTLPNFSLYFLLS